MEAPTWEVLKRIWKNPAVRSANFWLFFVPMASKALEKIPEVNIAGHLIVLQLPFSWFLFYLSAILFAMASMIFSYGCHPILKDYDITDDYLKEGKGTLQLIDAFIEVMRRNAAGRELGESQIHEVDQFVETFAMPQDLLEGANARIVNSIA